MAHRALGRVLHRPVGADWRGQNLPEMMHAAGFRLPAPHATLLASHRSSVGTKSHVGQNWWTNVGCTRGREMAIGRIRGVRRLVGATLF